MSDLEIRKNCMSLVLDCFDKVQKITGNGPDTLVVWASASVHLLASAIMHGETKEAVEKKVGTILSEMKSATVKYYLSIQKET